MANSIGRSTAPCLQSVQIQGFSNHETRHGLSFQKLTNFSGLHSQTAYKGRGSVVQHPKHWEQQGNFKTWDRFAITKPHGRNEPGDLIADRRSSFLPVLVLLDTTDVPDELEESD